MTDHQTVAAELVQAISEFPDLTAMADRDRSITYRKLGQFAATLGRSIDDAPAVGIFGVPGIAGVGLLMLILEFAIDLV